MICKTHSVINNQYRVIPIAFSNSGYSLCVALESTCLEKFEDAIGITLSRFCCCPDDGIGRHAGFRCQYRKVGEFESLHGHHPDLITSLPVLHITKLLVVRLLNVFSRLLSCYLSMVSRQTIPVCLLVIFNQGIITPSFSTKRLPLLVKRTILRRRSIGSSRETNRFKPGLCSR